MLAPPRLDGVDDADGPAAHLRVEAVLLEDPGGCSNSVFFLVFSVVVCVCVCVSVLL